MCCTPPSTHTYQTQPRRTACEGLRHPRHESCSDIHTHEHSTSPLPACGETNGGLGHTKARAQQSIIGSARKQVVWTENALQDKKGPEHTDQGAHHQEDEIGGASTRTWERCSLTILLEQPPLAVFCRIPSDVRHLCSLCGTPKETFCRDVARIRNRLGEKRLACRARGSPPYRGVKTAEARTIERNTRNKQASNGSKSTGKKSHENKEALRPGSAI